jgi:hypothetical protein
MWHYIHKIPIFPRCMQAQPRGNLTKILEASFKKKMEAARARYVRLVESRKQKQGKFVCTSPVYSSIWSIFLAEGSDHFGDARNRGKEQVGEKGRRSQTHGLFKESKSSLARERLYLYVVRHCSCRNARV